MIERNLPIEILRSPALAAVSLPRSPVRFFATWQEALEAVIQPSRPALLEAS